MMHLPKDLSNPKKMINGTQCACNRILRKQPWMSAFNGIFEEMRELKNASLKTVKDIH